ncbi:MAG: hypothetical protein L6277_05235 [Desulfobacterales bacterium]|nr:hypothetical protein [Pseudomonadota bacterium]MBU4357046.1 hypothetical protein [Pseudomonadota bacterium]MCG2771475.1 hypothetical protein [Desulfobacterales bacterium]
MRVKLNRVVPLLVVCILWWGVGYAWSAPIHYKQTMTKILDETQFQTWPPEYETYTRYFNMLTNSPDGSRIAFTVGTTVLSTTYVHAYVANSDGDELIDLTGYFPPEVSPLWTATYYKLDDTGSRLFFRAPNVGNDINIYYFDLALATPVCSLAVLPKSGETYAIRGYDARKPFSLTTIGGQITLFFKHVGDLDPVLLRYNQGIYSAPLEGSATKVMDINQVPGDENMNLLGFLGSAANANRILFSWKDVFITPGVAMWQTDGPVRVPDEMHDSVWGQSALYTHIISADGGKALYRYTDLWSHYLSQVDLTSGIKTPLAQTDSIYSFSFTTMAPSGNYAFFSSPGNNRTRVNLATGDQRDTLSSLFAESGGSGDYLISDITADDRYYFIGSKLDIGRIHRIDMAPTNFSQAPNIAAINFTSNKLLNDGTTRTTVTATVSDAQGPATISWVRLKSMVDGLETPEWMLGGEPLAYDWNLYDDGTHGDRVAGDGIYTNDTIRTKPTCNFYERFTLPKDVGVRIVARDENSNYVMADTSLTVVNGIPAPWVPLLLLD